MEKLAYVRGLDIAARERGYADYAEFEKIAGPISSVANVAGRWGLRGGMIGAGLGAAGNVAFGDQNQSMGQRAMHGALGGGLAGAGIGGAMGGMGQAAYRGSVHAAATAPGANWRGITQAAKPSFMGQAMNNGALQGVNKAMQGANTSLNGFKNRMFGF